jgi:hypothetical protein
MTARSCASQNPDNFSANVVVVITYKPVANLLDCLLSPQMITLRYAYGTAELPSVVLEGSHRHEGGRKRNFWCPLTSKL